MLRRGAATRKYEPNTVIFIQTIRKSRRMQSGTVQKLLPSAEMLSALLPGLFVAQTRSKTYTSNVMDETRTKRIIDHFAYHKARKQYRASLHNLYSSWRAELVAKQLADPGAQRRLKAEEAREEAARMAELLREKRVATLVEQVRKAELEHKLVRDALCDGVLWGAAGSANGALSGVAGAGVGGRLGY